MKGINKSLKKRSMAVISVVMISALLLAGTFAWNDFNQHKTDLLSGTGDIISVTLNDLYNPPDNWEEGQTVSKNVSVTNLDISTGPAFVRISIKEYLESILMDPDIFIEDNGEKVLFATWADGVKKGKFITYQEAVAEGFTEYGSFPVNVIQENGTTQTIYYATTTTDELKNGIYGKPMIEPGTFKRWGDVLKANISHELQRTDECDYEAYKWDDIGLLYNNDPADFIRKYIELDIGTQDVDFMFLDDWYANENKLGAYWIIDEHDGWVYWGEALQPGTSTADFIRSVTLNEKPGYTFEYYMHIDMEAVGGVFGFDTEIARYKQTDNTKPNYDSVNRLVQLYTFAQKGIYEVEVNGTTYYYRAAGTPKKVYYFCDTDGNMTTPAVPSDTPQYVYDEDDDCIKNGHLPDGVNCMLYDVKLDGGIYWAQDPATSLDPDEWRQIFPDGTLGSVGGTVTPSPTPTASSTTGGTTGTAGATTGVSTTAASTTATPTTAMVTTAAPITATPSPTMSLADIIATTPVGSTFTADGILWKVLHRDTTTGDVLIISNYVLDVGTQWHASSSANGYAQSNLRTVINDKYAEFTQLKSFAKVPSFNKDIAPGSTYANDITTCTANFAGGNTTDIMFALGYGDAINAVLNLGFSTDTAADTTRVAYDVSATTTARPWWLRTAGQSATTACNVYNTGTLITNNGVSNPTRGVRPALFINPNF